MGYVVTANGSAEHTGSTLEGPVASTLNAGQSFLQIEGVPIVTTAGSIDTPSHYYADDGPAKLYHSHPGQSIDVNNQTFVKSENVTILCVSSDGNSGNVTTIVSEGQSFVSTD